MSSRPSDYRWLPLGIVVAMATAIAGACAHHPDSTTSITTSPTPAAQTAVLLASQFPAIGTEIQVPYDPLLGKTSPYISMLDFTFTITGPAVAGARIEAVALDAAGNTCASALSDPQNVVGPTPVRVHVFDRLCALPFSTDRLRTTVFTGWDATRVNLANQTFNAAFSFRDALAVPSGSGLTIATLDWHDKVTGCGGKCSLPDDAMFAYCGAFDATGTTATVTLTINWDNGTTKAKTLSFSNQESASARHSVQNALWSVEVVGATVVVDSVYPRDLGPRPHGTATCSAVNVKGETASYTIQLPN